MKEAADARDAMAACATVEPRDRPRDTRHTARGDTCMFSIFLRRPTAFALRFHGRKRTHNADELMAEIVARRLVEHLERAGFVVMKRSPAPGHAALGRGFEGQ